MSTPLRTRAEQILDELAREAVLAGVEPEAPAEAPISTDPVEKLERPAPKAKRRRGMTLEH